MNEKIKENIEEIVSNRESPEIVKPIDKIEETVSAQEQEKLLQNIYKKPEITKEGIVERKDIDKENINSGLVKEFFSGADKAVVRLKKLFSKGVIDASDVDAIHDKITDKNKD